MVTPIPLSATTTNTQRSVSRYGTSGRIAVWVSGHAQRRDSRRSATFHRAAFNQILTRGRRVLDEGRRPGSKPNFRKIVRAVLPIMDAWGAEQVSHPQRCDLTEIIDELSARKATIITSQLHIDTWKDIIGDPTYRRNAQPVGAQCPQFDYAWSVRALGVRPVIDKRSTG